ncbi:MAG TPA: hypothetical protein PKC49_03065 [Phycisphaerae bacterium]|nr:hypothetical protein [Phycisphaerae bacterium]
MRRCAGRSPRATWVAFALALSPVTHAATFVSEDLQLTIGPDGKITSIIDRATGVERIKTTIPAYQPYLCVIQVSNVTLNPTGFSQAGDVLTYAFGGLTPTPIVTMRVRAMGRYLVFELLGVTNPGSIQNVRFVNLWTRDSIDRAIERYLRYSDAGRLRYLGLYELDPHTQVFAGPNAAGGYLHALAHSGLALAPPLGAGRAVALMACDADGAALIEIARQVEAEFSIPLGMAARDNPALRRSCLYLAQMGIGEGGLVLEAAQKAGVGRIMLFRNVWADARRGYAPPDAWGTVANLRAWIDECHAAGLLVGAHALPTVIPLNSINHIYAGCHPLIRRDRSVLLAAPVTPSQVSGLIQTVDAPSGWPAQPGQRDIAINGEIIEYTSLKTDASPYGFVGPFVRAKNQTGPGGLGPQLHMPGSVVGRLVTVADATGYQWSFDAGGVELQCTEVAAAVAGAGFDFVYSDSMEEVPLPYWYTTAKAVNMLRVKLGEFQSPPVYLESSAHMTGFLWPLVALWGQTDFYLDQAPFKAEVDRCIERMWQDPLDPSPRQMGWAPLNHPALPHATPDDLEYLLAKSAAYDMPVVFILWMVSLADWHHADANLHLIKKYEGLRLGGELPYAGRLAAREPRKDFMHFADEAGNQHFAPVSRLAVAGDSPLVRAFMCDTAIRDDWFVTLWPTAPTPPLQLRLPGVTADQLVVRDYAGNVVTPTPIGPDLLVPLRMRLYVQLLEAADPWTLFESATLESDRP